MAGDRFKFMARQDSEQSKAVEAKKVIGSDGTPIFVADKPYTYGGVAQQVPSQPQAPHTVPEPDPPYDRRHNSPMKEEYMKQMTAMMIMANLYNSSPGRRPEESAGIACDAADALWDHWIKNKKRVAR